LSVKVGSFSHNDLRGEAGQRKSRGTGIPVSDGRSSQNSEGVMIKAEIPFLSVAELSELIRKKEVSPVEATEAYLDRIDALDFSSMRT